MSTGPDYFDRMYQDPDPWSFEASAYEQRKYAMTLVSLPLDRYERAFEPGCSIGVLTEGLASRADELVAVDLHEVPVAAARRRLAGRDGVSVGRMEVPRQWPEGSFDLIVLSEVAYYFDDDDLALLAERVRASLRPGGDLVLVHWRGRTDYPQSGDAVHERWLADPSVDRLSGHLEAEFRIDVLRAGPSATGER